MIVQISLKTLREDNTMVKNDYTILSLSSSIFVTWLQLLDADNCGTEFGINLTTLTPTLGRGILPDLVYSKQYRVIKNKSKISF